MKKISVLLAVLMFLSVWNVQAANEGGDMAAAIMLVKERIEIPAECTEFSGSENLYNDERNWDFYWRTPPETETTASVSVTLSGDIIKSVYIYKYTEYQNKGGKILPKISEDEAKAAAYAYAERVNPSIFSEYAQNATSTLYGDRYSIYLPRTVGGIPVYNNSATVQVNSQTGQVENYRVSHTETAVFAGVENVIGEEAAKAAFIQGGYMKAEYVILGESGKLVYTPHKTGNMLDANRGVMYTPGAGDEIFREDAADKETATNGTLAAPLTPQEIKAVEDAAGLISYEEAAEKLKNTEGFYIPENLTFESGTTYKTAKGRYVLNISLRRQDTDTYARISAEVDGVTGEILYFSASDKITDEAKIDADAARAVFTKYADQNLADYKAALGETELRDNVDSFSLTAPRVENGFPVVGNGITMTVAKSHGKITYYRLNWDHEAAFPKPDGMLSEEAAYGILFEKAAPKLYYYAEKGASTPVYVTEHTEFAYIEAFDGMLLSYNGTPYKVAITAPYTDVNGHYAEEAILALASVGARLGDTEFLPDATITQEEYITLLSNCVLDYYPLMDGKADTDRIYQNAVRNGILPKEEEAPREPLTRELAVAYLLRAMGYEDFASIEGIFRCDFADADAIHPSLYGYVAIAKGLGLVKGDALGHFAPTREMTRAEAAVVIYNYLK